MSEGLNNERVKKFGIEQAIFKFSQLDTIREEFYAKIKQVDQEAEQKKELLKQEFRRTEQRIIEEVERVWKE